MVKSIYKGNLEVGTLYKGSSRIYRTSNVPQIVTPYQGLEVVDHKNANSGSGFYRYSKKQRADSILEASELSALGLKKGSLITGIALASNSTTQPLITKNWVENFRIAMKHTNYTTMPSVVDSYYSYQECYYAEKALFPYEGYTWYQFKEPFVYDGASNIMMSYSQDRTTSNVYAPLIKMIDTGIRARYYEKDSGTFPFEGSSYPSGYYGIPSMKLEVLGLGLQKGLLSVFIAKSKIVLANKSNYSIDSVANLQTAYNEAVLLFNNDNVTQEQVDADVKRFESVYSALVSLVVLKEAISIESEYSENMYTVESYTNFKTAIQNAKDALLIPDITPEAIDDYESAIWIAKNSLEYVPFPGGKLTSTPSAIVSDGLMGYWDTGGRTNESDSITSLPDISGNNWNMNLIGLNGNEFSGFLGGHGLKVDDINDTIQTADTRILTQGFSYEVIMKLNTRANDEIGDNSTFHMFFGSPNSTAADNVIYTRMSKQSNNNLTLLESKLRKNKSDIESFSKRYLINQSLIATQYVVSFEIVDSKLQYRVFQNGVALDGANGTKTVTSFDFAGNFYPISTSAGSVVLKSARFYNRALTDEEVAQNYNYEKTRWGLV